MPAFSHRLEVNAPQSEIFAILDDVSRTPEWLTRCTGIDKLDEGANTVGTKLKYHYKDGKRTGEMDGRITVHDANEHVAMLCTDKMMDVTVDFVSGPGVSDSTSLTHTIDIRTKGFGKVFGPDHKEHTAQADHRRRGSPQGSRRGGSALARSPGPMEHRVDGEA